MIILKKITKNKKLTNFILLFSLFTLMFPQSTAGQTIHYKTSKPAEILEDIKSATNSIQVKDNLIFNPLPLASFKKPGKSFYLTVTAYSSTVDQCDNDPFTTASGEKVRDGIIAYNYLPFGTRVRFPEIFPDKIFVVEDRLREGAGKYLADVWMPTRELALQWGVKILKIEVF